MVSTIISRILPSSEGWHHNKVINQIKNLPGIAIGSANNPNAVNFYNPDTRSV